MTTRSKILVGVVLVALCSFGSGVVSARIYYEAELEKTRSDRDEWIGLFIAMDDKAHRCIDQAHSLVDTGRQCDATLGRALETLRNKQ